MNRTSKVIQHLRRTVLLHDGAGLTDGKLLECFIEHRDEAAFAALVKRHGPMVWGVCHRLLNHHDAEDAFQATFLVLVRKAASIKPREMVGNWLYGVAHQTVLQARRTATRRRAKEKQVREMPETGAVQQDLWDDLRPLLDQELRRLPDKYRAVIVLCDLEGKTRKETAEQLGCPEGTVAGRLARARSILAKRLTRHGLAMSSGALAAMLTGRAASAYVPTATLSSTLQAASLFASGQAATSGAISIQAIALTEGVLKAMLMSKLKAALAVVLVLGFLATGATVLTGRTATEKDDKPPIKEKQGQRKESFIASKKSGAKAPEAKGGQKARRIKYEDFAELNHGGVGAAATGIRGKGGFTVVPLKSINGSSTFAISFSVKEAELAEEPDFQVVAVDGNGKRHEAKTTRVSAGGRGLAVVTLVAEFDLASDNIKSFVIQRRARYEDFVELGHGVEDIAAAGLGDKGGFIVVPLKIKGAEGSSTFAISFAVKDSEPNRPIDLWTEHDEPDYRVVAVDRKGKRHQAKIGSMGTAAGNGARVVTLLPAFDLKSEDIESFVIQRRIK